MLNALRRIGFRLLYNEFAYFYDIVSHTVSLGQWRCWQLSAIQFLPEPGAGVVLELAHGTGDLQMDLADAGYRAIGLDLSRSMGKLARRKLMKQGLGPALIRGDATSLPIPSYSIGALVSTFPTAFIFHTQCLAEIRRVLKPEGQAVIVLSALLTSQGLLEKCIAGLYRLTGQSYTRIADADLTDRFAAPGLTAEVRTVHDCHGLVQIVVLRRALDEGQKRREDSLDSAREA